MSKNDIAISVRGVSKTYSIAHNEEKHTRLSEKFMARLRNPLHRPHMESFDALKDLSFDIKKGEAVAIIGRNGAGKSTLLKILSRITEPSTGEIKLYGRVASLLEVGTGFHQELTGRENIYLNGSILGMTKTEIRKQFDAIVDFSEIEKFLDTPVKRYSSGMYVRLAFAVAAHLNPEILIVDEVLAVGDMAFQQKCLGKMQQVSTGFGRTVLFVSHNMIAVQALCTSGILLKNGFVMANGNIDEVVESYLSHSQNDRSMAWANETERNNESGVQIDSIELSLAGYQPKLNLSVKVCVSSHSDHPPAFVAVDILTPQGDWIMQAIPQVDPFIKRLLRSQEVEVEIELPPLVPGIYPVNVWIGNSFNSTLDWVREMVQFEIRESPTPGRTFPHSKDRGFCVPISKLVKDESTS